MSRLGSSAKFRHSVTGIVLAGGRSRRMGGGDKALVDLAGRPMLAHVLARLAPQVSALAISANGDTIGLSRFGPPVIADTLPGFLGPLAGVLSGLRWAAMHAPHSRHVVSVSTDVPFLPEDLVERLLAEAARAPEGTADIAFATSAGRPHPVVALWPLDVADRLEAGLLRGEMKVEALIADLGGVGVDFEPVLVGADPVDPFFNVNTPEDLSEARRLLGTKGAPLIGVAGWKNSGKTTLVVRLIEELSRRGFRVATIKHSHHEVVDLDAPGTDTARHRTAGAVGVALVLPGGWGVLPHFTATAEATLSDVVSALPPADVVIVEGMKRAAIARIEVRRRAAAGEALAPADPHVIAIAADHAVGGAGVPVFGLEDVNAIADLVTARLGLTTRR